MTMRVGSLLLFLQSGSSRRATRLAFVVLTCALVLLASDVSVVAADVPATIDPFRWR